MSDTPHPALQRLMGSYARELARMEPSKDLDARIAQLVAGHATTAPVHRWQGIAAWAAAAGFAAVAVTMGVVIGVNLDRGEKLVSADGMPPAPEWTAADLTMWPTDSVSFKFPVEYQALGALVAVDPNSRAAGTRYWVDVVVSNDGTVRIERIVPAPIADADMDESPDVES